MKIVRKHLNEIKRGGSTLSYIKVGKTFMYKGYELLKSINKDLEEDLYRFDEKIDEKFPIEDKIVLYKAYEVMHALPKKSSGSLRILFS